MEQNTSADIQLSTGIIFEFQKKPLSLIKRREREIFYDKMIWVIPFPRHYILEINDRQKYLKMYGDVYVKLKTFSEGFFQSPHPCPIFLDFEDGEMFRITEFEDYDFMRVRWVYGKFITKSNFINQFLTEPFLSDIEDIKISHYHQDIENTQKQLWEAQRELHYLIEELHTLKPQMVYEENLSKKQSLYYEIGKERQKQNEELQIKSEKDAKRRQEIIALINKIRREDPWGISTEYNDQLTAFKEELKKYPKKESWED